MAATVHPVFDNFLEALLLCFGALWWAHVGRALCSVNFDSVFKCLVSDGPLAPCGPHLWVTLS